LGQKERRKLSRHHGQEKVSKKLGSKDTKPSSKRLEKKEFMP
jgi:hypothetical protein